LSSCGQRGEGAPACGAFENNFEKLSTLTEPRLQAISRTQKAVWLSTRKGTIMNWETPTFEEIDMSAEIGSYQGEDDNGL
jgi:coenzyme PQQ precursor peptide PqqA